MNDARIYPRLEPLTSAMLQPMSFVTIAYSDECEHNLLRSECVQQEANELIIVDNRGNLFFENLGRAINAGLEQARNEIVAVVHEDVLLPKYWQQHLFRAIQALEQGGQSWKLLGVAGWRTAPLQQNELPTDGHWSDPHGYRNTLGDTPFIRVQSVDDQVMIVHRSDAIRLDPQLPGIHNIGHDLSMTLARRGARIFVVNAPTIHKYADDQGRRINQPSESPKIVERRNWRYKSEKSLSDDYFTHKWPAASSAPIAASAMLPDRTPDLANPVILVGKGGGGSRLISLLAADLGLFRGNNINFTGDTLDLVMPIYRGVLRKYREAAADDRWRTPHEIAEAAAAMLRAGGHPSFWGFKMPEGIFLLPEFLQRTFRTQDPNR